VADRKYSLREQVTLGLLARKASRLFPPLAGVDLASAEFSDEEFQQLISSMRDDIESGKFAEQVTKALRVIRERCNGHSP